MELSEAEAIAAPIVEKMRPHCQHIEIAGSVRRLCSDPNDIEIVYVAKTNGRAVAALYDIICRMPKVKGEPLGKYTQRIHPGPQEVKIDFFQASRDNWGLQLAIRTGSARFSHDLAKKWCALGYRSESGILCPIVAGIAGKPVVYIREEKELFDFLGMPYIEPQMRNL